MTLASAVKLLVIITFVFLPLAVFMIRRGWFPNFLQEASTEISVKIVEIADRILSRMHQEVESARNLRDFTRELKRRVQK